MALRRQLGRALRKAREAAGFTQSAVAEELGCRQGKINKVESTLVAISMGELEKLIRLYAIPDDKAAELRELASRDQVHGPKRTNASPAWSAFEQLRELEQDAREILSWHSERIPRPLQSEYYMLHQHHAETKSIADVVHLARQLEARARILTMDNPPLYRVILSESSLYRMPGGVTPGMVVDQVEHLLDLTRLERFTLQILTFSADIRFVDTDFVLLHFPEDDPSFAYIEAPGGARTFSRAKDIEAFEAHWRELRDAALSPADSKMFLLELVKKAKAEWGAGGNK